VVAEDGTLAAREERSSFRGERGGSGVADGVNAGMEA
jgi:hypothetical protein